MPDTSPQLDSGAVSRPDQTPADEKDAMQAAQLAKKDLMIATLTERLAEAADQLDRLQRMGIDRNGKGTGGLPREIVQQQQQLTGKLSEFVQRWDDAEMLDRLLRMEKGIEELVSAVSSGAGLSAPATHTGPADQPAPGVASGGTAPARSAVNGTGNFWEAAKAKMLAQAESTAAPSPAPATSGGEQPAESIVAERIASASAGGAESPRAEPAGQPVPEILEEPPAPQPVSAHASPEELQQAVDSRDAYIAFLVSRLRHAEQQSVGPVDWNALNQAPEELVERLRQLETQLKDQLARTEVAHSLERAALTRDRVRLQQVKQQLEQEIRRIGAKDQKTEAREKVEEKRLFRMIGRKKG